MLRTRGLEPTRLRDGDRYALGRTLQAILDREWEPSAEDDQWALAQRRVETPPTARPPSDSAEDGGLHELLARMAAPRPEDRPGIDDLQSELTEILERCAPRAVFDRLMEKGDIDTARACLDELQSLKVTGLFGRQERDRHIMMADLCLAQTPPDCPQARAALELAEGPKSFHWETQVRMGRAFAMDTSHDGHRASANECFARAADLSRYRADVVNEWVAHLDSSEDTAEILEQTQKIPARKRTATMVTLRTRSFLRQGAIRSAWLEVARSFMHLPFNPELYKMARSVAERYKTVSSLLEHTVGYAAEPGMAAAMSIAYRRAGRESEAAEYEAKARAYLPPEDR